MNDFRLEDISPGDKVYSIMFGWGKIVSISADNTFCVCFRLSKQECYVIYNTDGVMQNHVATWQTLFWGIPEIIAPKKPLCIPAKDTLVYVWDREGQSPLVRYSTGECINGKLYVYKHGATSITNREDPFYYNYWRLYDRN